MLSQIAVLLFVAAVCLQVGDFLTTKAWFDEGGDEKVGLDAVFMKRFGKYPGLAIAKALSIAVAGGIALIGRNNPVALWVLAGVNAFFVWVLWNNYSKLKAWDKAKAEAKKP